MQKKLSKILEQLGLSTEVSPSNLRSWQDLLRELSKLTMKDSENLNSKNRSIQIAAIEREQRIALLEHTQEFLNTTQVLSDIGGWHLEIGSQKLSWSKHTYSLLNYDPATEISIDSTLDLFDEDSKAKLKKLLEDCSSKGESFDSRLQLHTDCGRGTWIRAIGKANTKDGKSVSITGTVQNIEKIIGEELVAKDLYNQLVQASKMSTIGTMVAGTAHELNNPLTAIRGYIQVLEMNLGNSPKDMTLINKIITATERMEKIIFQLRRVSRDSSQAEWETVKINSVIESSLSLVSGLLNASGITIECSTTDETLSTHGDTVQLESVVQNLLVNSRDAFSENKIKDKLITIEVKQTDQSVVITYVDSAGGIPQSVSDRIFEPFFTTKAIGVGTGLGMSIARDIVRNHKGEITFSSEEGKGTTFAITLPKIEAKIQPQNQNANAAPSQLPHVLLVDDEPAITEILSAFLEDDFKITVSNDSEDALDIIANTTFDIILTDMRMPKVSGVRITEAAQKHQKSTPIILVTGQPSTDPQVKEALSKGAIKVINKPFENPSEIVRRVQQAIP